MNCPSCHTPLEPGARFCGVCGYRLEGEPKPQLVGKPREPTPPPDQARRGAPGGGSRAVAAGSNQAPRAVGSNQPRAQSPIGAGPARPKVALAAAKPKPRADSDPFLG